MASFAITGFKYSKSSSFHGNRPNTTRPLSPIYEDVAILQNTENAVGSNASHRQRYLPGPTSPRHDVGLTRSQTFHNYAYVANVPEVPLDLVNEKLDTQDGSNMNNSDSITRKGSIVVDITKRRFSRKKLTSNMSCRGADALKTEEKSVIQNNLNNKSVANGTESKRLTKKRKATVKLSKRDEKPRTERSSSLYQMNVEVGSLLGHTYGYNIHAAIDRATSRVDGDFRWPKLEPEPPSDSYCLCPAEKKIKNRLFVGCYIFTVAMVIFMLVITIEGWVFPRGGGTVTVQKIVQTLERPFFKGMFNISMARGFSSNTSLDTGGWSQMLNDTALDAEGWPQMFDKTPSNTGG